LPDGSGMDLTGHDGGALTGTDPGIPNPFRLEHSNLAELRILSQEKSIIGNDEADRRNDDKGYKIFFRF
jgi:hypothetical protein